MPVARTRFLTRASLTLAVVLGCSGPPDARDAGRDGGFDAGFDGGRDAGRDARADTGPPDAGPADATLPREDSGPRDGGPDDPGWVLLPGLPPDCPIERATHPERLWVQGWEPCTDAAGLVVAGCSVREASGIHGAWRSRSDIWLEMLGGDALASGRIVGIAPLDGPAVAAWREPRRSLEGDGRYCAVTALAVGGARAAFVAQFTDWNDMTRSRAWLYVGMPETIGSSTEPVHTFPAGFVQHGRSIHDVWISDTLVALQASPDGSLYTYRDGDWATLTGRGTVPGIPQGAALVADHLLWEAWNGVDDVRLVHARWGQDAAIWRDVSPGNTKGFGTDGADLAWFENYERQPDGSYARLELWTAQYRRDIENLEPVRVRSIDGPRSNRPAVGGGWLARRLLDPQRVEIYSLRDGTRRTFVAPGGFVVDDPYYASETEIMFPGSGSTAVRFDPTLLPVDAE